MRALGRVAPAALFVVLLALAGCAGDPEEISDEANLAPDVPADSSDLSEADQALAAAAACKPGQRRCSGSTAQLCSSRKTWNTVSHCAFVCSAGKCVGQCRPGDRRCSGRTPQICDSKGTWHSSGTCQFMCSNGVCTGS